MNKVCWELCGFKVTLKGLKQQQFYALPCLILQSFFFFFYLTFLFISSDIVPVVKHLSRFTVWDSLAFRKPSLLVAGHKKGRARTGISSCIWMPRQRRFWPETRCLAVPFLWTRYLRNARRDFGTSSHFVLIPGLINCIHLSPHLFYFFPCASVPPDEDLRRETMRGEGKQGKKCEMKIHSSEVSHEASCIWANGSSWLQLDQLSVRFNKVQWTGISVGVEQTPALEKQATFCIYTATCSEAHEPFLQTQCFYMIYSLFTSVFIDILIMNSFFNDPL